MNATEPAIELRNVDFSINGRAILSRINLRVAPGETLALLGRSGSGKTTVLRLINRLVTQTSGEVLVQGRATKSWDIIELRRGIGYVVQETGLFPHYFVARNVALVPLLLGGDRTEIA